MGWIGLILAIAIAALMLRALLHVPIVVLDGGMHGPQFDSWGPMGAGDQTESDTPVSHVEREQGQ